MQYSADQIVQLEFLEAIRRRPGMYIGNNSSHGLHHLLLEVMDNAVDECMAGYASRILVTIEKDGTVSVDDDGRGIPIEYKPDAAMSALTQVLVKAHAGGKFDSSAYSSSGGLHGIGLKATNAFSSFLEVEVRRYGMRFRQRFENGGIPVTPVTIHQADGTQVGVIDAQTQLVLNKKGDLLTKLSIGGKNLQAAPDPQMRSGTQIRFRPNRAWFSREMEWATPEKSVPWESGRLDSRFNQIAHLYPGVRIEFTDYRHPNPETQVYFSKNGLADYLEYLNEDQKPLHKPILFKSNDEIEVEGGRATVTSEIAIQYAGEDTQIYSFVNAIPTPLGGTHVTAFKAGLTKAIKQFASDKKLLKAGEDFKGDDALLGLTAIVKITMTSTPQFLSQTKESLTSPEVHGPVFSATYGYLLEYLNKNYATGKLIVSQATAAARGREAAAQARRLVIKKSAMDAGEYVLGKLADIQRRAGAPTVPIEHTVIYLVEGDSAGGSCKQGRDSRYHAILPLRGKIPNVEKASKLNELLKNKEIAAIVAAIGAGIGADFDIEAMRYGRVCILTDADVDGAHIATLLSTLFWRLMRPMIEAGKLYIARPPLYLVRNKKGQSEYVYGDPELEELLAQWGEENVTIQRYKGLGEMNPEQLRQTVFVVPESAAETNRKRRRNGESESEKQLTAQDFAERDLKVVIDDFHRTRSLIERLMGSAVEPRKQWLMQVNWAEE
ncbi:MAG: DNA topoisomerase (ATP-hydrolyzing) subunit B [Anaerolineales bacterium]